MATSKIPNNYILNIENWFKDKAWQSGVNADNFASTGIYCIQSGTNIPDTWGMLIVFAPRPDQIMQLYSKSGLYYREYRNGAWGTWRLVGGGFLNFLRTFYQKNCEVLAYEH